MQIQPQLGIIEMTGLPVRNTHPNNPWDWYISTTWKTHKNQPKNVGKHMYIYRSSHGSIWNIRLLQGAQRKVGSNGRLCWNLALPSSCCLFWNGKIVVQTDQRRLGGKQLLQLLWCPCFCAGRLTLFSLLKMLSSWKGSSRKRSPNWLLFSFKSIETVRVWRGARATYTNAIHIYIYIYIYMYLPLYTQITECRRRHHHHRHHHHDHHHHHHHHHNLSFFLLSFC